MAEVLRSLELQDKNPPETKETLVRTLDGLLERYLNLLHHYQSLQSEFSEHLSSVCNVSCLLQVNCGLSDGLGPSLLGSCQFLQS